MASPVFDPNKALGKKLAEMDKQELCTFISSLCRAVVGEVGSRGRRGGIYPENISIGDDGEIAVGPAKSGPWMGQELDFVAPEQYWNGQLSAASDVYAVGLLMYYAVSGGRLPLEGECEDPQLRRMGGGNPRAPKSAGRRLGTIIEKSLRFKASERYQTLEELRAVVDSCLKNLYLGGVPSSEAIFKKTDDDLDDVERMMVGTIEKDEDAAIETADDFPTEEPEDGVKVYNPAQKGKGKDVISTTQADMLAQKMKTTATPAVTRAAEESDPGLKPVTLSRNAARSVPATQYKLKTERERKIAEEVKKRRRRPLAVILVLCAVLVMVAIIMNAMLKDYEEARSQPDNTLEPVGVDPYSSTSQPGGVDLAVESSYPIDYSDFNTTTPGPSVTMTPAPIITTEIGIDPEVQVTPGQHGYQVFKDDVTWTQAAANCSRLGGHLVVINNEEEFNEVVRLAEEAGLTYVWIGAHRISGVEKWEDGKDLSDGYVKWAKGEPTYIDRNDQIAEDHIMLWNNGGTWAYNDNRDDASLFNDYGYMYSGVTGYICELNDK